MTERPYVLLSCAMSVDGCLDAPGPNRLILSGSADLDRIDAERAGCDAIMVGAATIRRDDPRLLIRSAARQAARAGRGRPGHPAGVTITASGRLDPAAQFFAAARGADARAGIPAARLVYCASPAAQVTRTRLDGLAEVIDAGDPVQLPAVLADLARRGIRRLLVEGGTSLGSQFLAGGLVDELHLAVAPFFVGDPAAPRFAPPGRYPHGPSHPMVLSGAERVGEMVLLRYLLTTAPAAEPPGGTGDG